MAEKIAKLYISLGVDDADLKVGFDKSEQTINQKVAELNQKAKSIKLRFETDINNAKVAGDTLKEMELKAKSYQQQMDIVNQKIKIQTQAYELLKNKYGETNRVVQQQKQYLDSSLNQLSKLNLGYAQINKEIATYEQLTKKSSTALGKFNISGINALKNFKQDFNGINNSIASFTQGITAINAKWMAFATAVASLYGAKEIIDSAVNSGENLYRLMSKLNSTQSEASYLNKMFSLGGTDINSAINYLVRLNKGVSEFDEETSNAVTKLARWGAELRNANGSVKTYADEIKELAKAYKNANAAGQGMEFEATLGPKGGVLMPVLQNYEPFEKIINSLSSTGLTDANKAHEAWLQIKTIELEINQLKNVLGQAFLPFVEGVMPSVIRTLDNFAYSINKISPSVKNLGKTTGAVFEGVTTLIENFGINPITVVANDTLWGFLDDINAFDEHLDKKTKDIEKKKVVLYNLFNDIGKGVNLGDAETARLITSLYNSKPAYYDKLAEEWLGKNKDNSKYYKMLAEMRRLNEEGTLELYKPILNSLSDDSLFGLAGDIEKQRDIITHRLTAYNQSTIVKSLNDVYRDKIEQLKNEVAEYKKLGIDNKLVSDYETSKLRDIASKYDSEVLKPLRAVYQNALEKRLQQIEQEKQAWIQKGYDEVQATEATEKAKKDLYQDSATNMFKAQRKYLDIYRRALASGGNVNDAIYSIILQMQKDNNISPDDYTTREEIETFSKAMQIAKDNLITIAPNGTALPEYVVPSPKELEKGTVNNYATNNYLGSYGDTTANGITQTTGSNKPTSIRNNNAYNGSGISSSENTALSEFANNKNPYITDNGGNVWRGKGAKYIDVNGALEWERTHPNGADVAPIVQSPTDYLKSIPEVMTKKTDDVVNEIYNQTLESRQQHKEVLNALDGKANNVPENKTFYQEHLQDNVKDALNWYQNIVLDRMKLNEQNLEFPSNESIDYINSQNLIDTIEKALSQNVSLDISSVLDGAKGNVAPITVQPTINNQFTLDFSNSVNSNDVIDRASEKAIIVMDEMTDEIRTVIDDAVGKYSYGANR